jgi:hypothetical protein
VFRSRTVPVLYELLTGHPDPTPGQLVFPADLTLELRAWLTDTWVKVGVDPQAATGAVVAGWHGGHLRRLWLDGADHRGGVGAGAAGHDLPACSSAPSGPAGSPAEEPL